MNDSKNIFLYQTTVQKQEDKLPNTYALHIYIISEDFADFHRTLYADFTFT